MNSIYALAIFAAVLTILTALYFLFMALLRNERRKILIQKALLDEQAKQAMTPAIEAAPAPLVNAELAAPPMPATPPNIETNSIPAPVVPPAPLAADGSPIYEQAHELVERSPILDVPNPIVQEPTPAAVTPDVSIPDVAASVAASDGKSSFGVRYSGISANRVLRDKRRNRNAS